MGKSLALEHKIQQRLQEDSNVVEFDNMLRISMSDRRFDSQAQLSQHLSEGSLLNVNVIGSKALSIPQGEYMVWATDAGHTMLVPIENTQPRREVFEANNEMYEIFTRDLLNNWSKVERVLAEAEEDEEEEDDGEGEEDTGEESSETADEKDSEIPSRIDADDVDRTSILRAMQRQDHTVTSLANAVGVDPPAISRILRKPKHRQGDPGGRNPSIGLASKIADELQFNVETLFPDIFGASSSRPGPKQVKGNRGSGMKGSAAGSTKKGKATEKWTQGDSDED